MDVQSTGIKPLSSRQTAIQEEQAAAEGYLKRCLIGLDQFMNVLTDGDADETISSRAARAAQQGKGWGIALSKFLDIFQSDHGAKAQAGDAVRAADVITTEVESGDIR